MLTARVILIVVCPWKGNYVISESYKDKYENKG